MGKTGVVVAAALTGCLAGLPVVVRAHHGTNQSYDRTVRKTVTGVVTSLSYRNPHPALFMDVTEDDGTVTGWTFEIAPTPYTLALRGWSKRRSEEVLKPGTVVTVTMSPSRAGTPVGLFVSAVNEKGEEIFGEAVASAQSRGR